MHYADTSFITSLYLEDNHSESAQQMMRTIGTTLPLTRFGEFELKNAIRASVIRRKTTTEEAEGILVSVMQDVRNGRLARTDCERENVFRLAESLSAQHTMDGGYRALDVLHVATAATIGCTHFLTFDDRQAQLATKQGLTNFP